MKKVENEILPKVGFAKLKFGMTTEQVINVLGQPEDKEECDDEGDIIYQYQSLGIGSLCFDKEEDFKLIAIELYDRSAANLWEKNIFGVSIEELSSLSKKNNFSLECESNSNPLPSQTLYTIDDLSLDFYFDGNSELENIVLGIFVDENDKIEWPTL